MSFCDICPEADRGYWAMGFSAWERCWANGRCMIGHWPGESTEVGNSATEPAGGPASPAARATPFGLSGDRLRT